MNPRTIALSGGATMLLMLGGCASTDMPEMQQLKSQLESERMQRETLQTDVESLRTKAEMQAAELEEKQQRLASLESGTSGPGALLPPNAKPGECYARVFIPPAYESVSKSMIATEASSKLVTTKPVYETVAEQVLVQEASKRLEVVPATYDWVEERLMSSQASEELVVEPAVYRNEEETVLVREAYTTWKKGRGPIERIDEATGEIMCLVEVPAQYKTVVKKVLVTPATTRTVAIPAQYRVVKKRVMVQPPRTVEVDVPAEYKTVRVRKLIAEGKTETVPIPETYQTVTQTRLVSGGNLEWKPILCETNTTPDVIRKLQNALASAGYAPGRIDGVLGPQTLDAVNRYQRANSMASGKLTLETLRKLQVI